MTLLVPRAPFAKALRALVKTGRAVHRAAAIFSLAGGELSIAFGGNEIRLPAKGAWPAEVRLPGSFLNSLARALPPEDPLPLRVENGRFYVSRLSVPCERRDTAVPTPVQELIPPTADLFEMLMIQSRCSAEEVDAAGAAPLLADANRRLAAVCRDAAALLRPYGVTPRQVQALCEAHAEDGCRKFRETELPAVRQIARVWQLLAPLGVETDEIKALMDRCLRDSWRTPS